MSGKVMKMMTRVNGWMFIIRQTKRDRYSPFSVSLYSYNLSSLFVVTFVEN